MRAPRPSRSPAAALLILAALAAGSIPAHGATYQGRSVDGRWYSADLFNADAGLYREVQVRFNGDIAYVQIPRGPQLNLQLHDEAIVDPRDIPARDHRRGLEWTIDVKNLR
jgi:hypothetical protein